MFRAILILGSSSILFGTVSGSVRAGDVAPPVALRVIHVAPLSGAAQPLPAPASPVAQPASVQQAVVPAVPAASVGQPSFERTPYPWVFARAMPSPPLRYVTVDEVEQRSSPFAGPLLAAAGPQLQPDEVLLACSLPLRPAATPPAPVGPAVPPGKEMPAAKTTEVGR